MPEIKLSPELRFPGHDDDWSEVAFENLFSFKTTNSLSREKLNYEGGNIKNIHYGDIHTQFSSHFDIKKELVPYINEDVDTSKIVDESYLKEGDLVIADASEDYNDIGKAIEILNLNNERVVAGLHTFLARLESDDLALGFMSFLMKTRRVRLEVMRIAQGTKVLGISYKRLAKSTLCLPQPEEQQKITDFLTSIDKRINLLEQKRDALERYKKGVMQKLFSQEIRFKDEDGNDFPFWEEKRLGKVFLSQKGKGLSKNDIVRDGQYECVLYGELYTTYPEVVNEIVSFTNIKEGTISANSDLLVPCSTTTTGIDLANVTALNKEGVRLGGDITILRSNDPINNVFYAYYLSNHKKLELAKYGQGTTIVHLYYNHFKKMMIDVPSKKEQDKIAEFLMTIDKTIKGLSEQIIFSQDYKKGLLQKMFI